MLSSILLLLPTFPALELPSTPVPADLAGRGSASMPFDDIHSVSFDPDVPQETVDRLWEQNPPRGTIVVIDGEGVTTVTFPEGYVPNLEGIEGQPGVSHTITE